MAAHSDLPFSDDKLGGTMKEVYTESFDTVAKVNDLSSGSQMDDALHDTEVLNIVDSEGNWEIQMLEGYDTEVVPDSDDEATNDVERKEFSCLVGSSVDGMTPPFSPCKQQRHPSVAYGDSRHVSGQSTHTTIHKGDDSTPFTEQGEIQDTEVLFEEPGASLVKDVDLANSISRAVFTDDSKQPSDRVTFDYGVKTREVHIVYARKKRRTSLEEKREQPNAVCECAGLSYVYSQEPEDLSKALLFVDKYVSVNAINSSPVANVNVNVKGGSPTLSSVKGVQRLVRSAKLRDKAEEAGIFEWDHDEDNVGKSESDRAELCFRGSKYGKVFVRRSHELKDAISKEHEKLSENKKLTDLTHSNAKVGVCDVETAETKEVNCAIREESEHNFDVGIDTQMAAEAIQELSFAALAGSLDMGADEEKNDRKTLCSDNKRKKVQILESDGSKNGKKLTRKSMEERSFEDSCKAKCMKKTSVKRAKRVKINGFKDDLSSSVAHDSKSHVLGPKPWFLSDYSKGKRTCRHSEGSTQRCNQLSLRSQCNLQSLFSSSCFGSAVKRKRRSTVYISLCSFPLKENCSLGLHSHNVDVSRQKPISDNGPVCAEKKQSISENVIDGARRIDNLKSDEPRHVMSPNHSPLTDETNLTRTSDGCREQAGKKKATLSPLIRELVRLGINESSPELTSTYSRRRKVMTHIRVLLSNNLDKATLKQQKKILARLGVPMVSCPSSATHFIADKFARTRNMLEFIAQGKPVVTHMWLESCEQAGSYIDERSYILRDAKKEQEIGFKLPLSLDKARQHPLLKGYKVFITQNAKPGQEMLTSLIKAAHGQVVDPITDCKTGHLDDLIILSCEEDADYCAPFVKRGAMACSPELILNGIVIQKLEFERHRFFKNHRRRR